MTDHGLPPVPPASGPAHSHSGRLEIAAGLTPDGEWRLVVFMTASEAIPAGHRIGSDFSIDEADVLVAAILQAQGDVRTGRIK